jgi:hypothetical protein
LAEAARLSGMTDRGLALALSGRVLRLVLVIMRVRCWCHIFRRQWPRLWPKDWGGPSDTNHERSVLTWYPFATTSKPRSGTVPNLTERPGELEPRSIASGLFFLKVRLLSQGAGANTGAHADLAGARRSVSVFFACRATVRGRQRVASPIAA